MELRINKQDLILIIIIMMSSITSVLLFVIFSGSIAYFANGKMSTLEIKPEVLFGDPKYNHTDYYENQASEIKIIGNFSWIIIHLPIYFREFDKFIWVPFVVDTGSVYTYMCKMTWDKLILPGENTIVRLIGGTKIDVWLSTNQFKKLNVLGNKALDALHTILIINYRNKSGEFFTEWVRSINFGRAFSFYDEQKAEIATKTRDQIRENQKIAQTIEAIIYSISELMKELDYFNYYYQQKVIELNKLKEEQKNCTESGILMDVSKEGMFNGSKIHKKFEPMKQIYQTVSCKNSHLDLLIADKNIIGSIFTDKMRPRIILPVRSYNTEFIWVPFLIDTACPSTFLSEYSGDALGFTGNFWPSYIEVAGKNITYLVSSKADIEIRYNNVLGTNFLNDSILVIDYQNKSISILPTSEKFAINWPPEIMTNHPACERVYDYITSLYEEEHLELLSVYKDEKELPKKVDSTKKKIEKVEIQIKNITEKIKELKKKQDL